MVNRMIVLGGVLQLLGAFFHIWLGFDIRSLEMPHRGLTEMLNVGVALLAFYTAYASFFHRKRGWS